MFYAQWRACDGRLCHQGNRSFLGGCIYTQTWDNAHLPLPYLGGSDSGPSWISQFGTFLILFNTLIPISLYVTMEFVKLVQAKLIGTSPCIRRGLSCKA